MNTQDFIAEIEAARHLGNYSAFRRRLIGEEQLWLKACRQAARQLRQEWLRPHLPGVRHLDWPLDLVHEDLAPHYESLLRSIAGCASAVIRLRHPPAPDDEALADLIYETAALWTRSRLRFAGMPVEPSRPLDPALRDKLSELLRRREIAPHQYVVALAADLAAARPAWQIAGFRDLVEDFLNDTDATWTPPIHLNVLLDKGDMGQVAILNLQMRAGGLGACYPDPRSMACFQCDQEFMSAQNTAWTYAQAQPWYVPQADVRWTLHAFTMPDQPSLYLDSIGGGSIGAAFGLGFNLLLDPQRPQPRTDWALTGAIDPGGGLRPVLGYPAKLFMARQEDKHVILPPAALEQAAEIEQWKTRFSAANLALVELATVEQAAAAIVTDPRPQPFQDLVPIPQLPIPPKTPQFVGRTAELAFFTEQLENRHLAVIVGPSGVGKTSLAAQLAQQVAKTGRLLWHQFHKGDGVRSIIEGLALLLAHHDHAEFWLRIRRLELEGQPLQLNGLLNEMIHAARDMGLVLWLDNVQHIAKEALLTEMIDWIKSYSGRGALKLIISSQEPLGRVAGEQKPLAGLDLATTSELLQYNDVALDDGLSAALHAKIQGNTQFLVLMIDLLKQLSDHDQASRYAEAIRRLPESSGFREVMELLDEQLSDDEPAVLAITSVLEYPSTRNAIEMVHDQGSLSQALDNLSTRTSLLSVSVQPSGRLYAQHDLVREFYYTRLGRRERRELHQRAGTYYATEEIDTFKAVHHLERAGRYDRAAALATSEVWMRINQGQGGVLRELLERFKAHQLKVQHWIAVLIARGEIDRVTGKTEQALMAYAEAIRLLETMEISTQVRERIAQVCRGMAEIYEPVNKEEALVWIDRGLNELDGIRSAEEVQLRLRLCSVLIGRGEDGDLDAALKQLKGLRFLSGVQRADALGKEAVIYGMKGEYARAISYSQQALKLYERYEHLWGAAGVLHNLGIDLEEIGDWERAGEQYQKAGDYAQRLNDIIHQSETTLSWGILRTKQGRFDEALELLLESISLSRDAGRDEDLVYALPSLAHLRCLRGEFTEAKAVLQEVEALAQREHASKLPEIYREQALLYLAQQQATSALPCARRAIELTDKEERLECASGLHVLGQVLFALGRRRLAQRILERSLGLFSSLDLPYEVALTKVQLGSAWFEANRERARDLFVEAQATFKRLGAGYDLDIVNALLDKLLTDG